MDADAAKYIAVGCMALGFFGTALGIGNIFSSLLSATSRNPEVENKLKVQAILGAALTESMGIFALFLAIMLIFGS